MARGAATSPSHLSQLKGMQQYSMAGIPVLERPHNHLMGMPQMERAEGKLEENSVAVRHQLDKQKSSLLQLGKDSSSIGLNNLPQLSCFGCGIGWFSFVAGFAFPLLWYYATILYFGNYYFKEPRERAGLAASAIAAMVCTATVVISLIVVFSDGK